MELIKIKNASYEWYEELLLKRDHLNREAGSLLIAYTKEFGELMTAVFEQKLACIRQKKAIAYCQSQVNRAASIDLDAMEAFLAKEMEHYYAELKDMMDRNEDARRSKTSSPANVQRAKRLYRKLAKLIHPDINPMTAQIPELSDLWNRIVTAYHANDASELKELEVLVNKAITNLGLEAAEIDIPDIDDRIGKLEKEIDMIMTTEPYTYQELLADPDAIAKKKESLQKELDEYTAYYAELENTLNAILTENGAHFIWKMN